MHEMLDFIESYYFVAVMCALITLINMLESKRRS